MLPNSDYMHPHNMKQPKGGVTENFKMRKEVSGDIQKKSSRMQQPQRLVKVRPMMFPASLHHQNRKINIRENSL